VKVYQGFRRICFLVFSSEEVPPKCCNTLTEYMTSHHGRKGCCIINTVKIEIPQYFIFHNEKVFLLQLLVQAENI